MRRGAWWTGGSRLLYFCLEALHVPKSRFPLPVRRAGRADKTEASSSSTRHLLTEGSVPSAAHACLSPSFFSEQMIICDLWRVNSIETAGQTHPSVFRYFVISSPFCSLLSLRGREHFTHSIGNVTASQSTVRWLADDGGSVEWMKERYMWVWPRTKKHFSCYLHEVTRRETSSTNKSLMKESQVSQLVLVAVRSPANHFTVSTLRKSLLNDEPCKCINSKYLLTSCCAPDTGPSPGDAAVDAVVSEYPMVFAFGKVAWGHLRQCRWLGDTKEPICTVKMKSVDQRL